MRPFLALFSALLLSPIFLSAEPKPLFDGKTLDNWEGNAKLWKVENGEIQGGSLTVQVEHNDFLATTKSYSNFDLSLKIKVTGTGFVNSGVQIRSVRVPNNSEMKGYQVDAGPGWWGKLYDESRRNKVLTDSKDSAAVAAAVKEKDWNEYRIRCEGPRIQSWINGVPALDYTEADAGIAQDGHIGIQVHGGGKALVQAKDIVLEELPPTRGAPTWEKLKKPAPEPAGGDRPGKDKKAAQESIQGGPQTPADEMKAFKLPAGFKAELVAQESEGIGKFITVDWDAQGRMWSMTALEYPMDANENPAQAEAKYAAGGSDKILVFDNPSALGPHTPRVFADGLVIPLGILPHGDGALAQYGHDIRHYRDTDGDGKADKHEIVLTGFGVQDSHLFPHQFLHAPGGWIYIAQGAFNASAPVRDANKHFADGTLKKTFNQCKLARFRPDGSDFQLCTAGPQNIWGLVVSREGETFLQEANDMGYPVAQQEFGAHYPTSSPERLQPYQPLTPTSTQGSVMGGTGLSGLALAEDRDGWPAPYGAKAADGAAANERLFYIANPITNRIQLVRAERKPSGSYDYEKKDDFLVSEDPWFRPVAIHFGPDGCLYIVDWYNKIISHNEVPRNHPERDKIRGRIWRIRHESQKPAEAVPNLKQADERFLLAQLGGPNALLSKLAWLEIIDRKAVGLAPELKEIVATGARASRPTPNLNLAAGGTPAPLSAVRRAAALWALEGLGKADAELLSILAADVEPNLRAEAVRIAGTMLDDTAFAKIAAPLAEDASFHVRSVLGDALIHRAKPGPEALKLAVSLGKEALPGNDRAAYERTFARYHARWALQNHPEALAAWLSSPDAASLSAESRLFAALALPAPAAALQLATATANLKRPLNADEIAILASQLGQPPVREAFAKILADPARRANALAILEKAGPKDDETLAPLVADAAKALLKNDGSEANQSLVARLAKNFRLTALEPEVTAWLSNAKLSPKDQALGLSALGELASENTALFRQFAGSADETVRREVVTALASAKGEDVIPAIMELWPALPSVSRKLALDRLTSSKHHAASLLKAVQSGGVITADDLADNLDKLIAVLGAEDAALSALIKEMKGAMQSVLRLRPAGEAFAETNVDLKGPFTVEGWVKCEGGITNKNHLLGRKGRADFNFYDGKFRLYVGHDLIIAKSPLKAETWNHVALTRDAAGKMKIYLNGDLDQEASNPYTEDMTGLQLGAGNVNGGAGAYTELRVWNAARSAEEIRDNHRASFYAEPRPATLTHYFTGEHWPKLHGAAKVELTRDFPGLLTSAQARDLAAKFTVFRGHIDKEGDAEKGKVLFAGLCAVCHRVQGQGGQIGPDLSGAGAMGTESLLRNILTPNAQLESGYYLHMLELKKGDVLAGLLVKDEPGAVTLRQIGAEDRAIFRTDIRKLTATRRSLMPEGLLEGMQPEQVADLFAYLMVLK